MGLLDRINEALEEASQEQQRQQASAQVKQKSTYGQGRGYSKPRKLIVRKKKVVKSSFAPKKTDTLTALITGYPVVWPSINWEDVGLGMIRIIGFVPNKVVKFEYKNGMWELTGARANSFLVYFLAAGGFGLVYFLQDLLVNIERWGTVLSSAVIFVPMLINLFVRNKTMTFKPYEIEMLAYDSVNSILVLSTLTQPGGVVAIKLNLPQDKKKRAIEEKRILTDLRKVHRGLINIDDLAAPDTNRFRQNLIWTFAALLLFGIAKYFG